MPEPQTYRKKPVEIQATKFEYSADGITALKAFCGKFLGHVVKARHPGALGEAQILTLEDGKNLKVAHIATEGDFIIRGVHGEYYACKPDIFNETYEQVKEQE